MKISRRLILAGASSLVASPFVAGPTFGQDAEFHLKLHHFLARAGNVPAKFITPWAKKIETESKGRIRIDIFPSMQLGGSPQQLFDQPDGLRHRHQLGSDIAGHRYVRLGSRLLLGRLR